MASSPVQEDEMNRLIPTAQIVPFDEGLTTFVATELDPDQFAILGSEFSEILEIKIPPTFVVSAEPGLFVCFFLAAVNLTPHNRHDGALGP